MIRDAVRNNLYTVVTLVVMQSVTGGRQDQPLFVTLDTIEKHPDPFLGREVSVDGEVEEVFSPRIFSIDEPDWADFDTEVLVVVSSDQLTLVHEGDRIAVTGRLQSTVGALFDEAPLDVDSRDLLADRTVIVARRIDVREREAEPRTMLDDLRVQAERHGLTFGPIQPRTLTARWAGWWATIPAASHGIRQMSDILSLSRWTIGTTSARRETSATGNPVQLAGLGRSFQARTARRWTLQTHLERSFLLKSIRTSTAATNTFTPS